eukprot:5602048-Alexandrium_andersonii.AAC.1
MSPPTSAGGPALRFRIVRGRVPRSRRAQSSSHCPRFWRLPSFSARRRLRVQAPWQELGRRAMSGN